MAVARDSRLIVGQRVRWAGEREVRASFADALPAVGCSCTDGAAVYAETDAPWAAWPEDAWPGVSIAKEETHTLEGINAGCPSGGVRTYRGRLKRRGRCFSRRAARLAEAVRRFVWHYNRRQRAINATPRLRDVLPLLF